MLTPSPARLPPARSHPADPRWLELRGERAAAHLLLAGLPFDGAVLGRKGAKDGPTGIREAFRFLASHDADSGVDLAPLRWHDLGDVAGLAECGDDVLAAHALVRKALRDPLREGKPLVALGGDNSLSFPVLQALADANEGPIGVVVVDAHYDVRRHQGQPNSGTSYRRVLEELGGRVRRGNLAEVGIRPYANTKALADDAAALGVRVHTVGDVRKLGASAVARQALAQAGEGVRHLWLSVDIDALDQSVASGCSAPGAGGLAFHEAAEVVHAVARDPRCRGMDLTETAPSLDPTGNTNRAAAQLVAAFAGALAGRLFNQAALGGRHGIA